MLKKIIVLILITLFTATPVFANSVDTYIPTETSFLQVQNRDREYKPIPSDTYEYEDCGPYNDCYNNSPEEEIFAPLIIFGVMGVWSLFIFFMVMINIAGIILNVYFLIDCANREFEDKTLWIVVLVVGLFTGLNIIVSLLYYFIVKRKLDGK